MQPQSKRRRRFIFGGVAAAGALVVGWGAMPPRQRLHATHPMPVVGNAVELNGWVAVAPDGMVNVVMARSEMGQGVHTALPMLVAEEMDVPLSAVRLVQAPHDKIYGNIAMLKDGLPFHPDDNGDLKAVVSWTVGKVARELGLIITGGSSSVKDAWQPMREAGAAARAMLVAAAAAQWKARAEDCRTEDGFVIHADGRRLAYGALAVAAATSKPGEIRLKSPRDFKLIGRPQPRRDTPSKVNGAAVYGLDVRPQGMVYAAVRMSPVIGGRVASVDADAVLKMPGVLRVVDFSGALPARTGAGAGVAVVAKSWWQARQAALALPVQWNEGDGARLSSAAIYAEFAAKLDAESGHAYHKSGDMDAVEGKAIGVAKTVTAEYRAPYLAHAAMEPVNCTAQVKDGFVFLWAPTQSPGFAVEAAAKAGGVPADKVVLEVTMLGGGFGRRLDVDMVSQVVAVARQTGGLPVQMIWSREDDTTHDVYRPAALARFNASLDAAGNVLGYDNKSASGSVSHQFFKRNLGLPPGGPDKTTVEGEFDMQYEFPNQRIRHVIVDSPVPLGYWRSVGHSHNAFFKESFIDELAHAGGRDSVAFRRSLLKRHPRHLAVLDAAVARAGAAPAGRAHGVALHQSFGTIVAQVAEVSVEGTEIRVHRVVCAVDCGIAVNPNIIAQQVESAVVFGLSAALYGAVTIKDGKVEQTSFNDYPVLRLNQAPEVETIIMPSAEHPEGMGEPATPPIAPAVANAVFKLTGKRLRTLPLTI
ncbi:xanthine dehydrogenase family protein molybdopterin-binding subunit [Duganella sp. BJB1802]|uniref:xanthine dehydrogenase family protein molybdopterin-binding subunit n=1 Tax=Duganella sp. BJB1802 TaxID=2744575 RepID=UPI001592C160|nr:molybdopterin cofactor-binding domain-containing protein [Duganella sp. BJB1802]NVD71118.1 xanthine dehydrogenase family protein molybdopterin-binding subunit [Duganella sp. BJB1802]